ncbi:MAG: hypothetical protein JO189_31370 [Deltaproteobacteria bacterium]|nr:hypothetical protein [Deltaproteobacteria bacterium]
MALAAEARIYKWAAARMLGQIGMFRAARLFIHVAGARCRGGGTWWRRHRLGRPFTVEGEHRKIEPPHVLAFTCRLTPEGLQAHKSWPEILVWLTGYVEH